MGIILTGQAIRLPLWGRPAFLVFYGGCCEPLPRCPRTVPLPCRACQCPAASNRITAPHAVPIKKSALIISRSCPWGQQWLLSAVPNRTPALPLIVTLTAFLFWGLLPLLLLVAVVDLLTMSQPRRVQLLRRSGMTQAAIADRLGISRYRVRQALA